MKKLILSCVLPMWVITTNAQITPSLTIPNPIPEYNGTYEDFGKNHFFYPNGGEIRFADEAQTDAIDDVYYYTKYCWPQQYLLKNNSMALVFSKHEEVAGVPVDSLHRIDLEMDRGNTSAFLARVDTQNTSVLNYFTEWFGSSGRTDVKGGASIACQSIYPNIDMVYTSNSNGLKIYYIVYPGGDPNNIILHVKGSKSNGISGNDLVIDANWESFRFVKPKMYQYTLVSNVVTPVNVCPASWQSVGGDKYKITTTSSWNSALPLVIQVSQGTAAQYTTPGLKWSTYFGGTQFDWLTKTHIDANDNLFVAGFSSSANFPAGTGGFQVQGSTGDGVIAKFNSVGQHQWSAFVGGSSSDEIHDFAFKGNSIYCVGKTSSSNLNTSPPKTGATNISTIGGSGWDGFILEIGPGVTPGSIQKNWLTYYGGNGEDELNACKFDASGNFYVVGASSSSNLSPAGGAGTYQQSFNSTQLTQVTGQAVTDAIIAKFNTSSLQTWFTFFGTDTLGTNANSFAADAFYNLAIDGSNIYACGKAGGTDLPNSLNTKIVAGNYDGILAHFTTGGALNNTKFTNGNIANYGVTVHWNEVFTVGQANSSMNPVNSSSYYYNGTASGSTDGCFSIHNQNLTSTTHNSFLGGNDDDAAYDIQFATNNVFYIAGGTKSPDFPTTNLNTIYDTVAVGLRDNFISCFQIGNTNLTWSTYLGSDFNESLEYPSNLQIPIAYVVTSIALTSQNALHVLGSSNSYNTFPLDDGAGVPYFQDKNATGGTGVGDGTITRIDVATINAIVGLKDFKNTEVFFGMYPNPTVNSLTINNGAFNGDDLHYGIYDMSGKKLKDGNLKANDVKSIDVSFLEKGIYVINVSNGKKTFSNKFIKSEN